MSLSDAHLQLFKAQDPAVGFALEYRAGVSQKLKKQIKKVAKAIENEQAEMSLRSTMSNSKTLADILPKPTIQDARVLYQFNYADSEAEPPLRDEPDQFLGHEPVQNPVK